MDPQHDNYLHGRRVTVISTGFKQGESTFVFHATILQCMQCAGTLIMNQWSGLRTGYSAELPPFDMTSLRSLNLGAYS